MYLVVPVHISELPLVAGDAHPLELRPQIDELPSFLPLLIVLFGVVGKRVEFLVANWHVDRKEKKASMCLDYNEWNKGNLEFLKSMTAHLAVEDAAASCKHHGSLFLAVPQNEPLWSSGTEWPEDSLWWSGSASPRRLYGGAKSRGMGINRMWMSKYFCTTKHGG